MRAVEEDVSVGTEFKGTDNNDLYTLSVVLVKKESVGNSLCFKVIMPRRRLFRFIINSFIITFIYKEVIFLVSMFLSLDVHVYI